MTITNHPRIFVVAGAKPGTVLTIDEVLNDFVAGRDDDCHLVLQGEAVSRLHASFFLDDEGVVTVSDTKSLSGVFVNGQEVLEHPLEDGDEISFGPPNNPAGALLLFVAKGSDSPIAEAAEAAQEEADPFLEALAAQASLSPAARLEDSDPLSELGNIAFDSPGDGPPESSSPSSQVDIPPFQESEPLPEPDPEPAADFLPEPEPLPVPERQPAADFLPEPEPLPVPEPQAAADFFPEPEPLPLPEPQAAADFFPEPEPLSESGQFSMAIPDPPVGLSVPDLVSLEAPGEVPTAAGFDIASDPDPLPVENSSEPQAIMAPEPVLPDAMPDFEELAIAEAPSAERIPEAEPPPPVPVAPPPPRRPKLEEPIPPMEAPVAAAVTAPKLNLPRARSGQDIDPLAGLAESLGGSSDERSEPPPPVPDVIPIPAKKVGASPAAMAGRLAVIAAVLGALAWFGTRQYADKIGIPVVDTYLPNPAEPGQTVTINGAGFGAAPDPTIVKVTLGSVEAQVLDANPTRINFAIPESMGAAGTQTVQLKVIAGGGEVSTARLLGVTVVPAIASLSPRVALAGDEVTINGRWLSNPKAKSTVTVAGVDAVVLEATPNRMRITIPDVAATEGQKIALRVTAGSDVSKDASLFYGRLPFIESVSPERALPGEVVTLTGLGLAGPDPSVVVGGRAAVVLSASDTELRFSVPGLRLSEGAGRRELRALAGGKTSIVHAFEVLRESSGLYSPRFFVESLADSRLAVSCELGPVMVLGSATDSAKRAHDAAARLNALASEGRTNRVQFTVTTATIEASGGPVLKVALGDGSGDPRVLAGLWAAHLTDMYDLFLQGRRGGRTLERSPDGRVYIDMFAAAQRRSSQPGVPQGLLVSLDPEWRRALASLAGSPKMSSSQEDTLVDGLWSGAIEVPGALQARSVEISLTATPSGLLGQRTSRQGRFSTDERLQNLRYARRDLRFSFVDSGEILNYSGRLDGDVISGSVTRSSGEKVGKLDFKLTR